MYVQQLLGVYFVFVGVSESGAPTFFVRADLELSACARRTDQLGPRGLLQTAVTAYSICTSIQTQRLADNYREKEIRPTKQ